MAEPSLASLLPRLFISMAVVILVMYIAARLLKNKQMGTGTGLSGKFSTPQPAAIQVLGRQGVGKNASVTVLRAGDKTLVIGVTDQNISLLAELDSTQQAELIEARVEEVARKELPTDAQWTGFSRSLAAAGSNPAWKGLLTQVRERTVRRS